MTRVNGNYQQPKTNLRDWKRTHKPLEAGQTLSQPAGEPKLREKTGTIEFPQSVSGGGNTQPVVTDPIATLNQELEAQAKADKLFKQERQLKIDQEKMQERIAKEEKTLASREKQLANLDTEKHPKVAKRLQKQIEAGRQYIQEHKTKLGEISQNLSNVQTEQAKLPLSTRKLSKEAQAALDMARNAEQGAKFNPAAIDKGLGIGAEESDVTKQFRKLEEQTARIEEHKKEAGPKQGRAWNEAPNSKIETRARAPKAPEFPEMPKSQKQKTNSLLESIMPNREQPVGKDYIAEANEAAKEAAINQQQKVRQGYLDRAHRAEEASKFHGTSQEAMDRLHGFNQGDSDVTKQFRELEAKDIADQKDRQRYLDRAHKAEEASKFHGTSQEAMDRLHGFNQEESDITKHFRNLEKESKAKAKIATLKKAGKIGLGIAAAAGLAYGVYKLFADDDKKAAPVQPEEKQKAATDSTVVKQDTTSVENDTIAAKENKEVETEAPSAENKSGVTPVVVPTTEEKEDAKVAQKENEEIAEAEKQDKADNAKKAEEAEKTEKAEQEYQEHIAEVAENYWKYAQRELIFEHQGEVGYKPSNQEIAERMVKIMERNGVELDKDGVHPSPMLKVGDKVKVLFEDEETAA